MTWMRGRNPNKTIVYGYKSPNAVDWTPFLKDNKWDVKVQTGLPMAELKKSGRAANRYSRQISNYIHGWKRSSPTAV